ncbi:DUF3576 domain-containing protein [Marinivivus vitaminiproducens]|uniref:DUF3576 domain-containing protein n=1 Tax=Marinivivus vitaminiproducens TaxID=3035935 RepID=UPI0027A9A450|nr:DUF3576 domain-containing protein [Geminicoccaceae bacterium SCSIO 64248]
MSSVPSRLLFASLAVAALAACAADDNVPVQRAEGNDAVLDYRDKLRARYGTISGNDDGFLLSNLGGGLGRDEEGTGGGGGIGVNSYLWRASLETIDFMPLASADPFGGVILTDWYTPSEAPNERFKLNVYIVDTRLRADGVKVTVLRQMRDGSNWTNEPVDTALGRDIEDKILTRARQLRIASGS